MLSRAKLFVATILALTLLATGSTILRAVNPVSSPGAGKNADLDKLWNDLASSEDGKVARALLGLSAAPDKTMALLKERLLPVRVDEQTINRLVTDLDSDDFMTREKAFAHLEYFGKYAKPPLEKVLKGMPSAEVKRRIEQLFAKLPQSDAERKNAAVPPAPGQPVQVQVQIINGRVIQKINGVEVNPQAPPGPTGPSPQWLRAARAVALLEHLNTPEARKLLEALAAGEADALPTKEAKAALDRLK
ncbi:MAG: hypothetical protein AB7K24_14780 [Gemmataceae bacterium]